MKKNKFTSTLLELGFSENEARVYCAALSLESASIAQISSVSQVKRTTIYPVIMGLQKKGLINIELKGLKKRFIVESPERLVEIFEEKKQKLENLIPEFMTLYNFKGGESFIKYYEGVQGIKNSYEQLLKDFHYNDYYFIMSDAEKWYQLDEEYLDNFTRRRSKILLDTRLIMIDSPKAQYYKKYEKNFNQKTKILPKGTKLSINLVITPFRVLLQQLTIPIFSIAIENRSIIEMHKESFEIIWNVIED